MRNWTLLTGPWLQVWSESAPHMLDLCGPHASELPENRRQTADAALIPGKLRWLETTPASCYRRKWHVYGWVQYRRGGRVKLICGINPTFLSHFDLSCRCSPTLTWFWCPYLCVTGLYTPSPPPSSNQTVTDVHSSQQCQSKCAGQGSAGQTHFLLWF